MMRVSQKLPLLFGDDDDDDDDEKASIQRGSRSVHRTSGRRPRPRVGPPLSSSSVSSTVQFMAAGGKNRLDEG